MHLYLNENYSETHEKNMNKYFMSTIIILGLCIFNTNNHARPKNKKNYEL